MGKLIHFRRPDRLGFVTIGDDSLRSEHIFQGFIAIIDLTAKPRDNQLAAILLDGCLLIQHVSMRDSHVTLQAGDDKLRVPRHRVSIIGPVLRIARVWPVIAGRAS